MRAAGAQHIVRVFVRPAEWKAIEHALADGGARSLSGRVVAFLAPDAAHTARWLYTMPVEAEQPHAAAVALDSHLRSQATELRLRMRAPS
jgi:hypothetical protein